MIHIKEVKTEDLNVLSSFIHELADYEKLSSACIISEKELNRLLFEEKLLHAVVIYNNVIPVGFATYVYMISTFKGKKILYIEDLFVRKTERGTGLGKALIEKLETISKENHCIKMEWKCLKWNKPAQSFYENFGAEADSEWMTYWKKL